MLTKSLWSPQTQSEKIWPSWPISCKNSVKMYWLSSKAPRPAPREHHEQRQVNLPRQVQVRGQGLIFRCGKEEDPAMLSDYAMPIHIQRLNLRMTLHYAWHNQPLYLQDHSCPTKALQRLTQVAHLFLEQPSVIQPENLRPVLKLVQRPLLQKSWNG